MVLLVSYLGSVPPLTYAMIVPLLLVVAIAAAWDLRTRRIPNWLTLTGVLLGFILNGVLYGVEGLGRAGLGLLAGFGVYLFLHALHAMGAGDVKLMAAVGAMVGWRWWFYIFFATVIVGAIAGLILVASRGKVARTFSNVGYIVSEMGHLRPPHLRREDLDVKSEKATRLAHGASIAAGTFLVIGFAWWQTAHTL